MVKINITTWSPDTCGCKLEYSWDGDLPAEQRVHTANRIVKECPEHSGLTKDQLYSTLLDENTRKNKVHAELLKNDRIAEDVVQENGDSVRQFKRGIVYDWNFDENRNLEVRVLGSSLSAQEKTSLQTKTDSDFGKDKVRVL